MPARSWQGWQVPIHTTSAHASARFVDIPRDNIDAKFAEGFKVAVVAGFQGVSAEGRITTLGRGGSDTTAVAFAAAFGAERCDIYTDVDGVYTTDPRITAKARKLDRIAFEEMLELASPRRQGAADPLGRTGDALQGAPARAVLLRGHRRDTLEPWSATRMKSWNRKSSPASPIRRDEAKMTLVKVEDRPGIAAAIFGPLAEAGVNVDMIVQNISELDERRARLYRHDLLLPDQPGDPRARRRWTMPAPRA